MMVVGLFLGLVGFWRVVCGVWVLIHLGSWCDGFLVALLKGRA
jgi:hypothetical protein